MHDKYYLPLNYTHLVPDSENALKVISVRFTGG
jgi:hypothetical protein